jgi:hypothetical protein
MFSEVFLVQGCGLHRIGTVIRPLAVDLFLHRHNVGNIFEATKNSFGFTPVADGSHPGVSVSDDQIGLVRFRLAITAAFRRHR